MSRLQGRHISVFLIVLLPLQLSCGTSKPKAAAGPTILPKVLKYTYSAMPTLFTYTIEWNGKEMVSSENTGSGASKTLRKKPTNEEWRQFWDAADSAAIWKWNDRYDHLEVFDGSIWNLTISQNKKDGHACVTGGRNGYPSDDDPRVISKLMTTSDRFDTFTKALFDLAGTIK